MINFARIIEHDDLQFLFSVALDEGKCFIILETWSKEIGRLSYSFGGKDWTLEEAFNVLHSDEMEAAAEAFKKDLDNLVSEGTDEEQV